MAKYFILLWLVAGKAFGGQNPDSEWLGCVVDLHLPRFGPIARAARSSGEIVSKIRLGASGEVAGVEFVGGEEGHRVEIASYLKESKFSPKCARRAVEIRFRFEVIGAPIDYPFSWVAFEAPNRFVIYTRPINAILEPAQKNNPTQKQ